MKLVKMNYSKEKDTSHNIFLLSLSIMLLLLKVVLAKKYHPSTSFIMTPSKRHLVYTTNNHNHHHQPFSTFLQSDPISNNYNSNADIDEPGDKIRNTNGIRPSLNPTIINILNEALLLRSDPSIDPSSPVSVNSSQNNNLEVAISASKLAMQAIDKRTKYASSVVGDEENSIFTEYECQLIVGRVVGVVMRWDMLEQSLLDKIKDAAWVTKYSEEASFGVLKTEVLSMNDGSDDLKDIVAQKLMDESFLRMCRAECLLALFIHTVEIPSFKKAGKENRIVSNVDFLDTERIKVLFPE